MTCTLTNHLKVKERGGKGRLPVKTKNGKKLLLTGIKRSSYITRVVY